METPKLLTLGQVCERIPGTPIGTVRHWVHTGELSTYKLGRRRYVAEADLGDFLAQRRREAVSL